MNGAQTILSSLETKIVELQAEIAALREALKTTSGGLANSLTDPEVCARLGINRGQLRRMRQAKRITCVPRDSRNFWYSREEVERLANAGGAKV